MVTEVFVATYCNLLNEVFDLWLDHMPLAQLTTLGFMHENALSHAARVTQTFLGSYGIGKGERLML